MFHQILLQIQTATVTNAPVPEDSEMTLLDLFLKGGYLMIPILILSVIAVTIFVERLLYLRKAARKDSSLLRTLKSRIRDGRLDEARELCTVSDSVTGRILSKALNRLGMPVREIENSMQNAAAVEVARMEKKISLLAAIATIAPMFGFLGTVVGMIRSFYNISIANDISIGIIAGGIYEKMITSAYGLVVGVTAYIMYTSLNYMTDNIISDVESDIADFMEILYNPVRV